MNEIDEIVDNGKILIKDAKIVDILNSNEQIPASFQNAVEIKSSNTLD